jgi:hypothetical protein
MMVWGTRVAPEEVGAVTTLSQSLLTANQRTANDHEESVPRNGVTTPTRR